MLLFTSDFLDKSLSSPFGPRFLLYAKHLGQPVLNPSGKDDVSLNLLFQLMDEMYQGNEAAHRADMLRQSLRLLFLKLESINDARPDRLQASPASQLFLRFIDLLEKHYRAERNATFYADQLNISYKHLNQTVKKTVGQSVKHFIDRFVVLEMERQLVATDRSVKTIAYEMGFDEPTNFVKFFKRHHGISPARYRTQFS
ncbi:MAG: helix-turn-helix domain-containing protein, partial [Bacteroidota bacterium]